MAELASWTDGPTKSAIVDFVGRVTAEGGPDYVAPESAIAVFDNDGTLWCEKPMYIQLDFILRRLAEKAEADPSLRDQQPYKAAYERRPAAGSATVLTKHYQGDDTELKCLLGGDLAAHRGDERRGPRGAGRTRSSPTAQHPTLGRGYLDVRLRADGRAAALPGGERLHDYIVSGGGRDFMRPITRTLYGIPPERVVGSSTALEFAGDDDGGTIMRKPEADFFDDGPEKPVRHLEPDRAPADPRGGQLQRRRRDARRSRSTRQAVAAAARAARRRRARIRLHRRGREGAGASAEQYGWTVVSMKNDWATVFA